MNSFLKMGLAVLAMLAVATGCKSKKIASTEASAVAEASTSAAAPMSSEDGSSLLWEISGNGLEQPSYLFGTIHLIGSEDFIFPDTWTAALDQTQHLMLELDMDDPRMMMKMMTGAMMEDGKSLKDLVSEEEYEVVKTFFKDSLNQPIAMLGKMKPMLLSSSLYPKMINGEPVAYEMVLIEKAKEREMEVTGVETVEDQLAMVDEIPMDDQIEMLMTYIEDFQAEKERFGKLIDLYVAQDVNDLYSYMMDSPEMDESAREVMLDNRNKKWIPVISEQAAAMPTFFAFGAGHLAGENGVINLLQEAGFSVKPVR